MTEKQVPRLELRDITKIYPSVVANDGVSLSVMPGEIHAVLEDAIRLHPEQYLWIHNRYRTRPPEEGEGGS